VKLESISFSDNWISSLATGQGKNQEPKKRMEEMSINKIIL
jgi:hypothetical protein